MLGVRIGENVRKLQILDKQKSVLEAKVRVQLPGKDNDVISFLRDSQLRTHTEAKARQQHKFQAILKKTKSDHDTKKTDTSLASQVMSRWVKNCSDRLLSD